MTLPKIIRAFLRLRGFTLIEMLAVIAIIGILAGLLIPAVVMVKKKARVAKATSDISGLSMAIEAYIADFGAPPPDTYDNANYGDGCANLDTPNKNLIWFLTREYSKSQEPTDLAAATNDAADVDTLNARVQASPYFGVNSKYTRDYYGDGLDEFIDPWGRPYMYRAWVEGWQDADYVSGEGTTEVDFDLDLQPTDHEGMHWTVDGTTGYIIGRVEFQAFTNDQLNGNFSFEGTDTTEIRIEFNNAVNFVTPADGEFRFPLHNKSGYDLYSLGPNGITRAADRPHESGVARQWKPWAGATERAKWEQVWGTPGDGNDTIITGGNVINSDTDRDDINNW